MPKSATLRKVYAFSESANALNSKLEKLNSKYDRTKKYRAAKSRGGRTKKTRRRKKKVRT